MAFKTSMLVLAAAVLMAGVAHAGFVMQEAVKTHAVRDATNGRIYQSFTSPDDDELVAVSVPIGTRSPCRSISGKLYFAEGDSFDFDNLDNNDIVASADIVTSCEDVVCEYGDCISWQRFELNAALVKGHKYVFAFDDLFTDDMIQLARLTVSPYASGVGGASSVIKGKFPTKYDGWSYRIEGRKNRAAGESAADGPDNNNNNGGAAEQGTSGASNGLAIAGIVVPVIALVVISAFVAVYVKQRRGRTTVQPSRGDVYNLDNLDNQSFTSESSAGSMPTFMSHPSGHRRPIHVRSNDVDAGDMGTWADRVKLREGEEETFV